MSDAFPTVKLRYAASDDPSDVLFLDYFIDVGNIATEEGVSHRLHNLGLLGEELAPAVTQFQALTDLPITGAVDDATRSKLGRVYRAEVPLVVIPPVQASGPVGPLIGDGPPEANPRFADGAEDQLSGDPFGEAT